MKCKKYTLAVVFGQLFTSAFTLYYALPTNYTVEGTVRSAQ